VQALVERLDLKFVKDVSIFFDMREYQTRNQSSLPELLDLCDRLMESEIVKSASPDSFLTVPEWRE